MPLTPDDWNVVVLGHWNRAILTPAGIAKRLFGLPEGTPIKVMVPLDVVAPFQVQHEGVIVVPARDRLIVQPSANTVKNLADAMAVAGKALEDLPQTPVFAAGVNIRYKSETAIEVLQQATANVWDDRLSDNAFAIESWSATRIVAWEEAKATVTVINERSGACAVHLNFEMKVTESSKLRDWLRKSIGGVEAQVCLILKRIVGLQEDEIAHG